MANFGYVIKCLIRRLTPSPLFFWMDKVKGSSNWSETRSDTLWEQWYASFVSHVGTVEGKHVLEIGSGRYAAMGPRLIAHGAARVTLVDLYAVPVADPSHNAILAEECRLKGLDPADTLSRIEVIKGDITLLPVPPAEERADLLVTKAVLEHVRDPGLVFRTCVQWMKPGAKCWHRIDLRDHHDFLHPLEMLTFSDRVWERYLAMGGGFYQNRWRLPEYLKALQDAGWTDVSYEVNLKDGKEFNRVRPHLAERWRRVDPEMLSALTVGICAVRSEQGLCDDGSSES
jgi:SAM-dependent methyltransferase